MRALARERLVTAAVAVVREPIEPSAFAFPAAVSPWVGIVPSDRSLLRYSCEVGLDAARWKFLSCNMARKIGGTRKQSPILSAKKECVYATDPISLHSLGRK